MMEKKMDDHHQTYPSLRYFGSRMLLSFVIIFAISSIFTFSGILEGTTSLGNFTEINGYHSIQTGQDSSIREDNDSFRLPNAIYPNSVEYRIGSGDQIDESKIGSAIEIGEYRRNGALEVAWLMSFPNSGTTYTNHMIQAYTNTTTATNYGHEQSTKEDSIPVFTTSVEGPFFRYPSWSLPPKYILTKTHCGGECDACHTPGQDQYNETINAFEISCRSGKRIANHTKVPTVYAPDIPKRAVHLIRDPFDNIVARLHLKERRWARQSGNEKYEERVDLYNRTKEGFRAYCRFRDARSFKVERKRQDHLSIAILNFAKQVPCYAEFITYTRWHNNAIELLAKKSIPSLTLFYEDYASDWDGVVHRLLDFLLLTPAEGAETEEFILGKHYEEYYEDDEKEAAMNLVRGLASPELWHLIHKYFA